MSLTEFQRAFSDLIASPALVLEAREAPDAALAAYALTARERRRLVAMCASEAMEINCTLYRVNRLTPIYSVLPRTCRLLGPALAAELSGFWRSEHEATLQFHRQAVAFAAWLDARACAGGLAPGPWQDALQFELAAFEVRTAPGTREVAGAGDGRRRRIALRYDPGWLRDDAPAELSAEPLVEPLWIWLDATGPELAITVSAPGD